jgi:hypothetical protein
MTVTRTRTGWMISGDSIDLMMGMSPRSTICRACRHTRGDHKRSLIDPSKTGTSDNEAFGECERRDRRRTTSNGVCPCVGFVEPRLGEEAP